MNTSFKLVPLSIETAAYASQGSALLGIRGSGKTYTATLLAEKLFEAKVPFVAFDPIGVWRFLKMPGKGKGYPVVVAGGKEPDLPLTVNGAPEIMRAAMRNGVSVVIGLFDINLCKADWKRIVTACVRVLLHENSQYALVDQRVAEARIAAHAGQLLNFGVDGALIRLDTLRAKLRGLFEKNVPQARSRIGARRSGRIACRSRAGWPRGAIPRCGRGMNDANRHHPGVSSAALAQRTAGQLVAHRQKGRETDA